MINYVIAYIFAWALRLFLVATLEILLRVFSCSEVAVHDRRLTMPVRPVAAGFERVGVQHLVPFHSSCHDSVGSCVTYSTFYRCGVV